MGIGTHDERLLRALETSVKGRDFDRIIISGDITERGDPASLARVRLWLLEEISLSSGPPSGLRLGDFAKVRIIPGNHDAFAAPSSYKFRAWQESVKNFFENFDADQQLTRNSLSYEWIEKDNDALFIVYLNTCYLGGADLRSRLRAFYARTARGNLTVHQTDSLLAHHDRGQRGKLTKQNEDPISGASYRDALKIAVMHHFIVPPATRVRLRTKINIATCMKLNQRRRVFANLALADIAVILCGHSHLGEFQEISVRTNLDRRAQARHLINRVRERIGVTAEPLREKTRSIGKNLQAFAYWLVSRQPKSGDLTAFKELIDQLLRGEDDFKAQLIDFLNRDYELGRELDEQEVNLLTQTISALNRTEKKQLKQFADEIIGSAAVLQNSRVLQAMNGSTTKRWSANKRRTYFEYEISKDTSGVWEVRTTRYDYIDPMGFAPSPGPTFRPTQ